MGIFLKNLTVSQEKVFRFIKSEIKQKGYPPAVREICEAVGLKSTSSVHAHLETLERLGYIYREKTKNRSIEILEQGFYSNAREMADLPVVGVVTAGVPILAVENIEGTFPIPVEVLNSNKTHFMLRVKGDSMIEKGIHDNDLVIVKQQSTAENGDMVVALIEDSATVKTFYREQDHIRLQPENPSYEPIIAKDVSILGVVTGLFRKY